MCVVPIGAQMARHVGTQKDARTGFTMPRSGLAMSTDFLSLFSFITAMNSPLLFKIYCQPTVPIPLNLQMKLSY